MHTPDKMDLIIKMAQRCASPLPWEPDVTRANEKIFELWTALKGVNALIRKAQDTMVSYLVPDGVDADDARKPYYISLMGRNREKYKNRR